LLHYPLRCGIDEAVAILSLFRRLFTVARKPADQSVNRDDIIMAAADVLQRKGYEAATMKDIAAQVKLTAASLYHHFRNKDELLLAVLEMGLDLVIDQMEPVVRDTQLNATQKLRRMIAIHIVNVTQHTAVGAAMVFEIRSLLTLKGRANGDADTHQGLLMRRDAFFERRRYFERMFRQVLRQGADSGEFKDVDVQLFSKVLMGAHNWVAVWYREGGRLSGLQVAEGMADIFLVALGIVQPTPP
jgi:TetR/AcrR family transcriptional regulator, cholesterol catabolism regulator